MSPRPAKPRPDRGSKATGPPWLPWIILAIGIGIRVLWPISLPRTPDEDFFTIYARDVVDRGPGLVAEFVRYCHQHPESGMFPWPQRVGYIWMSAALMAITGSDSMWLLVGLSAASGILVMVLAARLALRHGDAWVAGIALLFLATSPLDLAIARRAWQDDVVALFTTAMLLALARHSAVPKGRRWAVSFFVIGSAALLIKETALPVLAIGTAYLAWRAWRAGRGWRGVAGMAGGGLASLAAAAALITVNAGGPRAMVRTFELARVVNAPNEYMRTYQTGSPLYYLEGLGRLQPFPFLLGAVGVVLVLIRRWPGAEALRRRAAPLLEPAAWLVTGFGLVACLYPQKNLRFVSVLFAPVALLAALLLRTLFQTATLRVGPSRRRAAGISLGILLAVLATADLARYHHWFVVRAVPDLATPWFRK